MGVTDFYDFSDWELTVRKEARLIRQDNFATFAPKHPPGLRLKNRHNLMHKSHILTRPSNPIKKKSSVRHTVYRETLLQSNGVSMAASFLFYDWNCATSLDERASHTQAIKPVALIKESKGHHLDRGSEILDITVLTGAPRKTNCLKILDTKWFLFRFSSWGSFVQAHWD